MHTSALARRLLVGAAALAVLAPLTGAADVSSLTRAVTDALSGTGTTGAPLGADGPSTSGGAGAVPASQTSSGSAADGLAAREVEPVVITGQQLPDWSRLAAEGAPNPSTASAARGTRSAHDGQVTVPPDAREGVDPERISGYRWDGVTWQEVPVQVDERFPYFLANGRSDFGIYSGTDQELTYAWNPTAHSTGEEAWKKMWGECIAQYAPDNETAKAAGFTTPRTDGTWDDYTGPAHDPVPTLDDDDEIAFMASDAGKQAPAGQQGPAGTDGTRQQLTITDPTSGEVSYLYLFLEEGGSSFTHENGYVHHERTASADWWADRDSWSADDPEKLGSSNTGYGANLPGTACVEAQGTDHTLGEPRDSSDRFPLDGMTVTTDTYRFHATGRWMKRSMQITAPGTTRTYGEDLVDRWKGRAFQQSPDSEVSLVGFEDEQVNWEANAVTLGWRSGPVRTIREIWGADSGTNVTKTEIFYRDAVKYRYRVRVHPIPPDGLYTNWDYNRGTAACYFDAALGANDPQPDDGCPGGVAIDGRNDDLGNVDGAPAPADCNFDDQTYEGDGCQAYTDLPDPTVTLPSAVERWEQVAGRDDNGSLVYLFEFEEATSLENAAAVPYYRDDECFDDGTGDDPAPRPYPGRDSSEAYPDHLTPCTAENATERQGAHGSHGLHFFATHDTDNAHVGAPINELDGSQWQFAVPTASPQPVGEAYANVVRAPSQVVATPQANTPAPADATLRAGAAAVDVSWHVGASSGQYAGEGPGPVVSQPEDGGYDPAAHSLTSRPSYGIESRAWARALLVEGVNGQRWALLANDLYIPQDLLNTRVATILEEHDRQVAAGLKEGPTTGISVENLSITTSHSHASPFYSSTAWGVWAFQDVFDIRFFEFMAQKMADAVIEAAADLRPARVGAASAPMTLTKRNPEGPTISDHGVPAAYPYADNDPTYTVIRFDDVSDPGNPTLMADWIVFGRHPEGLDGNDIHSGEYYNNLWRILDREVGGVSLMSQNDVGTSEVVDDARAHAPVARQEWDHNSYNQRERLARRFADLTKALLEDIATVTAGGEPTVATDVVPARSDLPVGVHDLDFAPPSYRPFPTVSNCRAEEAAEGNPGVPIVGLPDCGYFLDSVADNNPLPTGATYEDLQTAGVPLPDNIGGPSYTGLQETLQVHLQAVRIGGLGITLCPCEQFTDMSRNIRARLNATEGDLYFGWDWTANYQHHPDWQPGVIYDGENVGERDANGYLHGPLTLPDEDGDHWCEQNADGDWVCKDPRNPAATLDPISDLEFRIWKARIYNDARGWDEYLGDDDATPNALEAEAEPDDPEQIWGNWIHEELTDHAYEMVVPVSMANDYWGYIPPYSEFQNRDYYRKALAGLGPHSADFLVTRLTRMAAELNGAPDDLVELTAKDQAYEWDSANQRARAETIGRTAQVALPAYEAQLPPDGGTPAITSQPDDITRFQAAEVTWVGGSNYTDVPHPMVERCLEDTEEACAADGARWAPFGDGFGEVQVLADFPDEAELPLYRAGQYEWRWTAFFEAYDSDIARADASGQIHPGRDGQGSQVPDGIYRFTIEGCHRGLEPDTEPNDPDGPCSAYDASGRVDPYQLTSEPFRVGPWQGITVEDPQVSEDWSTMTFDLGPTFDYPITAANTTYAEFASDNGRLEGGLIEYSSGIYTYEAADVVDYPHALDSPFPYIETRDDTTCLAEGCDDLRAFAEGPGDDELFCFECHFEAWAETGAVDAVTVTVIRAQGNRTEQVAATFDPTTGTWSAPVDLKPGDEAFVAAGAIVDRFGETNGKASAEVRRPLGASGKRLPGL